MRDEGKQGEDRWPEGWVESGEGMLVSFLARRFPAHTESTQLSTRPKRCICTHAHTKTHFVKLVLGLPLYQGSRDVDVFA